ncbi:MAG: hypothetical protein ACO3N7_02225 [Kiritimatiellia bacterium]
MIKCIGVLLSGLFFSGCALFSTPEPSAPDRPPAAGIIRQVNRAEYYFVFESGKPFPPGAELRILRNGQEMGRGRAREIRQKKFQAADILEGAPQTGDLCEIRPSPLQDLFEPQAGDQSQSRRLRP